MTLYRRVRYHDPRHLRGVMRATGRSLMPPEFMTKLVYAEAYNVSVSTGTTPTYLQFCLNSCYDPNYTNVGHQPMGYDQLTPFYENYLVHGCKVIWKGSTTNPGTLLCMSTSTNNQGGYVYPNSVVTLLEDRNTRVQQVTTTRTFHMERYYPINRVFGITRQQLEDEDNYSALFNTSPISLANVGITSITTEAIAHVIVSTIQLIYYVKFYAPRNLGTSALAALLKAEDPPVATPSEAPDVLDIPDKP